MESAARVARNELFQQLKPCCVELSQLALKNDGSPTSTRSLIQSTNRLFGVLSQSCQILDGPFDDKLADYVFFPLSQILQKKKTYTDSLSESTIKCLTILLEYGWRRTIALDLAKQLLILLTFVSGGVPGQTTEAVPEELVIEGYKSLAALFRDLSRTPGGSACLVETSTVPALGHCVTVMLDGITEGASAAVQVQGLQTLNAVWHCVKDPQALSSFLPGTISALTKCLMPTTVNRRSRKTIIAALDVLEHVLLSILSDIRTRNIKDAKNAKDAPSTNGSESKLLTKSWLKATTAQIKLALSNVIRLRSHEAHDVRKALNKLCLTLLDECHDTLSESGSMLVETCMTLSGIDEEDSVDRSTTLTDLATIHPDIGELIKGTIYNWATSLPRIMLSNDEKSKHVTLDQLSKAHKLLTDLDLDSTILEDTLVDSLRDSVTATMDLGTSTNILQEAEFDLNSHAAMSLVSENATLTEFRPMIMPEESRKKTRGHLTNLLQSFGSRETQMKMASKIMEYARGASGPSLLSAYWLATQLLKSATANNKEFDEFFSSSLTLSDDQETINQELFSFSLSILSNLDDEYFDWRVQAIALEVMASSAQTMKESFRTELVDVLYPITQLLGSPNSQLREHAITCLNIVSRASGYANASDLIIDNADYMVNAISLRLNTFDISPQAPQVLIMMIRLTGPSLLLYLDDVVGSIFAALDNFHGYGRLVEVLFSVLGEIVEVGSKSTQLQIEATSHPLHRKTPVAQPTIAEILTLLAKQHVVEEPIPHEDFPKAPWKSAQSLLDETENSREDAPLPSEVAKLPPTKIYTMLRNIAHLSQHYLTSSSPHLRTKLLALLRIAIPSLARDEDVFLPLINDIWEPLVARVYDSETYVAIAAMDTISALCVAAGDFLGTRFQDAWVSLLSMARKTMVELSKEKKGAGERIFSQVRQKWEAIGRLFGAIIGHVRVPDEGFDEVVELLREDVVGDGGRELREALEGVNADAVWLTMHKAGKLGKLDVPVMEGCQFASVECV